MSKAEVIVSVLFEGHNQPDDNLESVVGHAIGAGSACWDNLMGAGVFQSERASQIVDDVVGWVNEHYVALDEGMLEAQNSRDLLP